MPTLVTKNPIGGGGWPRPCARAGPEASRRAAATSATSAATIEDVLVIASLLVRLCRIRQIRPETCCAANCSTPWEIAFSGSWAQQAQLRELRRARPCDRDFPSLACDTALAIVRVRSMFPSDITARMRQSPVRDSFDFVRFLREKWPETAVTTDV